jgi:hypothetical protein
MPRKYMEWNEFKAHIRAMKAIKKKIRQRFVVPISAGFLEMLDEHAELERLAQRSTEKVLVETKQLLKILEAYNKVRR